MEDPNTETTPTARVPSGLQCATESDEHGVERFVYHCTPAVPRNQPRNFQEMMQQRLGHAQAPNEGERNMQQGGKTSIASLHSNMNNLMITVQQGFAETRESYRQLNSRMDAGEERMQNVEEALVGIMSVQEHAATDSGPGSPTSDQGFQEASGEKRDQGANQSMRSPSKRPRSTKSDPSWAAKRLRRFMGK
jgi:hypothetical protein